MTLIAIISPVELTVQTVVVWLALGFAAIAFQRRPQLLLRAIFPLTALRGLALMIAGWWGMHDNPSGLVLPLGLPDLPFHLRLDPAFGVFPAAARRRCRRELSLP